MATRYTRELLQKAVDNSTSFAGVLRYLGLRQAGGTQTHIATRVRNFGIDTSHFTGQAHNRGKSSSNRRSAKEILVVRPEGSHRESVVRLKRAMLEVGLTYKCECGMIDEWQGQPISLEIDHIDGNCLNNTIENLRFLCPNCHSQQVTGKPWKHARVAELGRRA